MPYRLLADAVVLLHLAFVVFVVCGGLLVVWRRWIAFIHLPAAGVGRLHRVQRTRLPAHAARESPAGDCRRRRLLGDFVERYLIPVLYPPGLRRDVQVVLGLVALAVNAAVYVYAWRRSR